MPIAGPQAWNEDVSTVSRPLAGLTIIEAASKGPLALDLALGLCGRIAADLGANVIRLSERADTASDLTKEEIAFLHAGKKRLTASSSQFDHLLQDVCTHANALLCAVGGRRKAAGGSAPQETVDSITVAATSCRVMFGLQLPAITDRGPINNRADNRHPPTEIGRAHV